MQNNEIKPLDKNATVTIRQCAKMLGISRSEAYMLALSGVKTGKPFKAKRAGGTLKVSKSGLESYIENNR